LVRTLACYGIETSREELEWFAEAFWSQSIALKLERGWKPPTAWDLPARVFEAISQVLDRPASDLGRLMELLIDEWKHQAGEMLYKHGLEAPADWLRTGPRLDT
jgi:aldehyde:ferredoxin oxidoreductase